MSPVTTLIVVLGGASILFLGNGLFGTLVGVRASLEAFGESTTGVIMSAYFLGYVLGSFVFVAAIERVGHIRTLAGLSAVLAATATAHAIFLQPLAWAAFRMVTGLCIVGFFLVIESWLNSLAPENFRGRIFSIYMTVNLLAVAAGQYLLVAADPKGHVLFGVVTMLFALSLVPTSLTRIRAPAPQQATGLDLRALYDASPAGVVGCVTCGLISGSFWGMGPVFASRMGFSDLGIAAFMSAIIIGGMAAQWPIGWVSDRIDRRKAIAATAGAGAVAAALTAGVAQWSFPVLLAGAALFGASLFPLYSLSVARTHDVIGGGKVLETTRGLILVFGVGAVVGPLVSGWVMGFLAPRALFIFFAVCLALFTGFAVYRLPRGERVPAEDQTDFVPFLRTSQEAVQFAEDANLPDEP